MPVEKDTLFGKLAVERGYAAQAQVDEARAAQEAAAEAAGVTMPLSQVMVGKGMLTRDQAQELVNAAAVQTGEARLVAGYEVVAKLGQGGMGAVYKAKKLETGNPLQGTPGGEFVALKILPPSMATERLVARFKREAEITSRLDHEHIVRCVEVGYDRKRKCHFCTLEYIEGEDLGKRLKREGATPEAEAVGIAFQIAQALRHANANGLVHRDVKPANIMVTPDGTAKLLDLGLARPAGDDATRFTQDGLFVGSAYYASPEQGRGEADLDVRSDIYSLGCTLYHMVTGSPPFEGLPAAEVVQKHTAGTVPWPAEVNPALSDGICRVVAKMMGKKPEERYQDPKELLYDLDMLREGRPPAITDAAIENSSVALRGLRPRRRRPASQRRMPGAAERSPAREKRRRRPGRAPGVPDGAPQPKGLSTGAVAGIGVGIAAVVGIVVAVMFGGGPDKPAAGPALPPTNTGGDTLPAKTDRVTPRIPSPGAGQPTIDTRKVSPPERSAADALRGAEVYEKAHPGDLAGIIARYQAVSRDFPGTRQAGEAEIQLARVRSSLAAREREPVPPRGGDTLRADTGKVTSDRGHAAGADSQVPAAGVTDTSGGQTPTGRSVSPEARTIDLAALLGEFDAFMRKSDYAGAREYAESLVRVVRGTRLDP
ncbi:MAG: serine/threonine-protein kinase [Planctomycetota bacterium]|jgi:serine/threonine-protein kinase